MPSEIDLTTAVSDSWLSRQTGRLLDDRHYDRVLGDESVIVLKPSGQLLFALLKKWLPLDYVEYARRALWKVGSKHSEHRGFYLGIFGYFNGRQTEFTRKHRDDWGRCLPLVRSCDAAYRLEFPAIYERQVRFGEQRIAPDLFIARTIFTTGTANRWDATHNARSPVHDDRGDIGFGLITAITSGSYTGGYFCFPRRRLAVDLRIGDLVLFAPDELHGNTLIDGRPGWERVAVILYTSATNVRERAN